MAFNINSNIGSAIDNANIPRLEKSYECFPAWFVICFALSQFGTFLGCFFGIRGPEDQWPWAWWAFGAIPWWAPFIFPAKIVRTPDAIQIVAYLFGVQETIKIDEIKELELAKSCCGVYVKAKFTDDSIKRQQEEAGLCKCCVSGSESLSFFSEIEFCLEHGIGKETNESA
eukprot:CAMPEP_0118634986 /NCGR_PEP_ID=MMETSP0785-20121206/1838_1 /TAXON_ID=91992 /ORGANISM="Bolidomonas pacifica, Strain CCMP 1866" /LENGTH=170 /DNA_ID=CAMNT_0006525995 /DNA_START=60 /DNA_END=572 /DNA_ORIENTATION=-